MLGLIRDETVLGWDIEDQNVSECRQKNFEPDMSPTVLRPGIRIWTFQMFQLQLNLKRRIGRLTANIISDTKTILPNLSPT